VHEAFGANADVWLFGSGTDDTKRGGDIDLFIETDLDRDIVARRSASSCDSRTSSAIRRST
jgi:hypothetical protein